jgi:hypothetical protein
MNQCEMRMKKQNLDHKDVSCWTKLLASSDY